MPTASEPQLRSRGTFPARILDNRLICLDHYRLRLSVAGFPPSRAGQFIQVQCGRPDPGATRLPREAQPLSRQSPSIAWLSALAT